MKKTFLLLLLTVFVFILTVTLLGCSEMLTTEDPDTTESTAESTTENTTEATTEAPLPTVGNPSIVGYKTTEPITLPNFYINTDGNVAITSRDTYVGAGVTISNTLNDEVFGMTDRRIEVRCRGNFTYTSATMQKKSYRLKFEEKVNLFAQGKGASKSWVLLANHCDKTLLRNHLAFTLGSLLTNIDYCSSSSFVHLYVNDKYMGIYQLAEQHNANESRINITEDPDVIDTDYLIERDYYAMNEGKEGKDYFLVGKKSYNIKTDYPDSLLAEKKCEFLRQYFQKAYDAILSGKQADVEKYIDLPSMVDTFILQAMTKNIDVGWSSFFMVKKAGDKIYFTCPWDFDLAFGNDSRLDNGGAVGLYTGDKSYMMQEHEWFYLLMNNKWFCNLVRARWNAVSRKLYNALNNEIDRFASCFADEFPKNFDRWRVFATKINQEPSAILKLSSWDANVTNLKSWIKDRYEYLDKLIRYSDLYKQGGQIGDEWWLEWTS